MSALPEVLWNALLADIEQRRASKQRGREDLKKLCIEQRHQISEAGAFVPTVTAALAHPNFRVRLTAVEILGVIASPSSVDGLLGAYERDSSESVKRAAEGAILALPAECIPELVLSLNRYSLACYVAENALIQFGEEASKPLCDVLSKSDRKNRRDVGHAVRILTHIGVFSAGPALESAYIRDIYPRWQVLEALSKSGAPHAVEIVRHALADREPICRWQAAKMAGRLQLHLALPELIIAARDVDSMVRTTAVEAINCLQRIEETTAQSGRALSPLDELHLDDPDTAIILDLRNEDIPEQILETFLLPIREANASPLESFQVSYLSCIAVELWKQRWSSIESTVSSPAVLLPEGQADALDSILVESQRRAIPVREWTLKEGVFRARISLKDGIEAKRQKEDHFPYWRPLFIALPKRFDGRGHRVKLVDKPRTDPLPRARTQVLPEHVDLSTVPPLYHGLRHPISSSEWLEAERNCVRNAFSLGRLRLLSKGTRKTQVQISSPGSTSRPSTVKDGLFEWHMCAYAYRAHREHVGLFERGAGVWTSFFAFSELQSLPHRFMGESASAIGSSLGIAVAIWNAFGRLWVDLWDAFDRIETAEDGFCAFYEQFQAARGTAITDKAATVSTLIEKTFLTIVKGPFSNLPLLEAGAPARIVMEKVGIDVECMEDLAATFSRWDDFREILSARRVSGQADTFDDLDLNRKERADAMLSSIAAAMNTKEVEEACKILIRVLDAMGVDFAINHGLEKGRFSVRVHEDGKSIRLTPVVELGANGANASALLVLLHEIGHAALHCRWQAELRLMAYCAERIQLSHPAQAALIRGIVGSARTRLLSLHSAVERSADRFALRFALTPAFVKSVRSAFVQDEGVRLFELDAIVRIRLGIQEDRGYYKRFGPIVWEIVGIPGMATEGAFHLTGPILDAMDEASRYRVEALLKQSWTDILVGLEASDSLPKAKQAREHQFSGFGFDGITCT